MGVRLQDLYFVDSRPLKRVCQDVGLEGSRIFGMCY